MNPIQQIKRMSLLSSQKLSHPPTVYQLLRAEDKIKFDDYREIQLDVDTEMIEQKELFGSAITTLKIFYNEYGYFIRPTEKVFRLEFEDLFGLKPSNEDYNENMVLFYPSSRETINTKSNKVKTLK